MLQLHALLLLLTMVMKPSCYLSAAAHDHYYPPHHDQVRLTVVEIYCERVRDLLDPLGRDNLAIKQGRDGGTFVEGAVLGSVGRRGFACLIMHVVTAACPPPVSSPMHSSNSISNSLPPPCAQVSRRCA